MSDALRRRSASLRFFAGVALMVALACVLAAVDLWGGVRTLGVGPKLFAVIAALSAALIVSGAVRWARSWPEAQRARRSIAALAALGALAATVGGGLFAYYASRLGPSANLCRQAACASAREERDRLLDEGLGPLFPVIDPAYECIALERERRAGRQTEESRAFRETVRCRP